MRQLLLFMIITALPNCRSAQAKNPANQAKKTTVAPNELAGEKPLPQNSNLDSGDTGTQPTAEMPKNKTWPKVVRPLLNPYESAAFFKHQAAEHKRFGIPRYAKSQKKKKYGNSVVMQRSGRKRLYDHNILLRAIFAGHLHSAAYGDLGAQFTGGVFLDIGSAIQFGEGAETVRDLHDDDTIRDNLTIIASDINDPEGKKSMFVKQYRESDQPLPFPVVEVPRLMNKPEHFSRTLRLFLRNRSGIILRSANSGPDLYYDTRQMREHLCSAIQAFADKNLLYLFNKFILYKPADRLDFLVIGEIDETVGINHKKPVWNTIDWAKRTFADAVRLNAQHAVYR
jgi:hypothetical protein